MVWEHQITKETLTKAGHVEFAKVRLCQTGVKSANGKKVGKALCFTTNSTDFARDLRKCFGECVCVTLGIIGILSDFSAGESQGSFRIVLAFSVLCFCGFQQRNDTHKS